jgi:hypothetical protein
MNCTGPVARSAHAADRTALPRIKPRQRRWSSHSQRSEGPYISGRKEGHEFRSNLVRQGTLHSA